jgi:hypothetical protein
MVTLTLHRSASEDGLIHVTYGDKIRMPADDFHRGVEEYLEDNAGEVRETVHVLMWCAAFFVGATVLFVYSEVKLVLVTREADDVLYNGARELPTEMQERKKTAEQSRTMMLIASVAIMIISMLVGCFSVCFVAVSARAHAHPSLIQHAPRSISHRNFSLIVCV